MAIELQPIQSSKKKSKKDKKSSKDRKRKDRDTNVSSKGDLVVDEGEETGRQRKKRKREREGAAIDGALSFSLALQSADMDAHAIVDAKERKDKKKATDMDIESLAVEPGACPALEISPVLTLEQSHALNLRRRKGRKKRNAEKLPNAIPLR